MKTRNVIFLAILGIIYWAGSKIIAGLSLIYSFGLPQSIAIKQGVLQFYLPLELTNRTAVNLNLNRIDLDFSTTNGSYIGRALMETTTTIPGYKSNTVNILVRCNLSDLLRAIPDLRTSVQTRQIDVLVTGKVTAERISLNISDTFGLAIPQINL